MCIAINLCYFRDIKNTGYGILGIFLIYHLFISSFPTIVQYREVSGNEVGHIAILIIANISLLGQFSKSLLYTMLTKVLVNK